MSAQSSSVRGAVRKQSRLGISWNSRYLIANGKDIKIYRNQQEYEKNGKCKYAFNMLDTVLEKIGNARRNEVKIAVQHGSKKYKFQLPQALWLSLSEYYKLTNIQNQDSPINDNASTVDEEQKTQETASNVNELEVQLPVDVTESSLPAPQNIADDKEVIVEVEEVEEKQDNTEAHEPQSEQEEITESQTEETELEQPAPAKHGWNCKYKEYLDVADEDQRSVKMTELLTEFCSMCKTHCIDLIENTVTKDVEQRNQTFIRDEIEFKVIQTESEYEEIRLSVTNWKQYATAFDGEEHKLYTPLSCILEYLNFRIYCKACCDFIKEENLRFGQSLSDGTFKSDERVSSMLDAAAKKLNLSAHACKFDEKVTISTSSNIKIYESEQNEFYIHDVAELYPIDIVHFLKTGTSINIKTKQCVTRLHPKLVHDFAVPVSSDAFVEPDDDEQDETASKAIYNLHSNIIPKFTENINNLKVIIVDCNHFQTLMSDAGISMIYIGEIYNLCKLPYARQIIQILMIAHTIKHSMMFDEIIESKEEYEAKINYYINCFSNKDDSYDIEAAIKQKIMSVITIKYGVLLKNEILHSLPLKFMQQQFREILSHQSLVLSVPDRYISADIGLTNSTAVTSSLIASVHQKFEQLRTENSNMTCADLERFQSFKTISLQLIGELDQHFAAHALRFDMMNTICQTYVNMMDKSNEDMVDYACALYNDCHQIAATVFGKQHRQTVCVQIEICKLSFSSSLASLEYAEKLENTLKSVHLVFAKNSVKAVPILSLLSETYLNLANYDKAYEYAKQLILILDEKKKYDEEVYFNAHLQISLIAEKTGDFGIGVRFMQKLYNHLKKNAESKKQKLWDNIDIKMLCISLSRFKLKMCADSKFDKLLKKCKAFEQDPNKAENATEAAQQKTRELLIQNLCLNPIHKSNELLRDSADTMQVICWMNIIKEFETNFLGIQQ